MRRSKIVCTSDPTTPSEEAVRDLIEASMSVLRVNRSHSTQEEDEAVVTMVRRTSANSDQPVTILVGLQGPKIRLSTFANGSEELVKGQDFTTTTYDIEGDSGMVSTACRGLSGDCGPGDELLVDDGSIRLQVTGATKTEVQITVEVLGKVSDHKSLNLPGAGVFVSALFEKGTDGLRWVLKQDVDFIALSFVRRVRDIESVHQTMSEVGRRLPVIAKVGKSQAVENPKGIIQVSDAAVMAREDLGVEIPLREIPTVQKRVIGLPRLGSKPVIVAAQVLESMIFNPHPTHTEASNYANMVRDGASVMILSRETTVRAYPVKAMKIMARIIGSAENDEVRHFVRVCNTGLDLESIIARHKVFIAQRTGAKFIVAFAGSRVTACHLARLCLTTPPYAFYYHEEIRRQLQLAWGVKTYPVALVQRVHTMVHNAEKTALAESLAEKGDMVIYVGGLPPGQDGHTSLIRVHSVGSKDDV